MGVDCNNCKNKGKCGTSIAIDLIRTGGKDAFIACKSYAPKFFSVKCPNCDCIIHVDTTSKPQTNGDRIRSMTDEELAEFLLNRDLDVVEKASKAVGFTYKVDREPCLVNVIDWLKEEEQS